MYLDDQDFHFLVQAYAAVTGQDPKAVGENLSNAIDRFNENTRKLSEEYEAERLAAMSPDERRLHDRHVLLSEAASKASQVHTMIEGLTLGVQPKPLDRDLPDWIMNDLISDLTRALDIVKKVSEERVLKGDEVKPTRAELADDLAW